MTELLTGVTLRIFNADWCLPCKIQKTITDIIRKTFEGKINILIIDIDTEKGHELVAKYSVISIPTIVIEADGWILHRHSGVMSVKVLDEELRVALKTRAGVSVEKKTVQRLVKLDKSEHPARCPCCNFAAIPGDKSGMECANEGKPICGLMCPRKGEYQVWKVGNEI